MCQFFTVSVILPKPKNVINTTDMLNEDEGDMGSSSSAAATGPKMAYRLLGRDNKGRVETRQFLVPQSAQMCINLAKAEVIVSHIL